MVDQTTDAPPENGLELGDIIPFMNDPNVAQDASSPMNCFMGFMNAGIAFEAADTLSGGMANLEIAGCMPEGSGFEALQASMQGPAPAPSTAPTMPGQDGPSGGMPT